jgi:uncharacterized protein with PIN domain
MTRFLLDAMCGGLDAYLRICGHDAAFALDRGVEADNAVLALARAEDRRLVTRDRQLATQADGSLLLTERDPVDQLVELATAGVDLTPDPERARCRRCNGRLDPVSAADETPEYVPADVADAAASPGERASLWRCVDCGQYFWRGSHWERVEQTLATVRERAENRERTG